MPHSLFLNEEFTFILFGRNRLHNDEKFLDYGVRGTDMKLFGIRHWQSRFIRWTLIDTWTYSFRISRFDCQAVCLLSSSFQTIMNSRLTQGTRGYYSITFTNCKSLRDSFDFQTLQYQLVDKKSFFLLIDLISTVVCSSTVSDSKYLTHTVWLILFWSSFALLNLSSWLCTWFSDLTNLWMAFDKYFISN